MSYQTESAGNRCFHGTLNTAIAYPLTLLAWVKVTAHPVAFQQALCLCSTYAGGNFNNSHHLRTNSTDDIWHARSQDGSAGANVAAATKNIDGVWAPWIGRFNASGVGRDCDVSDQTGTNGSTRTVTAGAEVIVGASAVPSQHFDGLLAEVAIWDKILDSTELADIKAGTYPNLVAPSNCVAYYPLSTNGDLANYGTDSAGDLTAINSPTFSSDHPVMIGGGGANGRRSGFLARPVEIGRSGIALFKEMHHTLRNGILVPA